VPLSEGGGPFSGACFPCTGKFAVLINNLGLNNLQNLVRIYIPAAGTLILLGIGMVVWVYTLLLYITLYYDLLRKLITFMERRKLTRKQAS